MLNEQDLQEDKNYKNEIVVWIKAHKKQLILIGISIPTFIALVLGLKKKDAINELFDNLKAAIEESKLYSSKWFQNR